MGLRNLHQFAGTPDKWWYVGRKDMPWQLGDDNKAGILVSCKTETDRVYCMCSCVGQGTMAAEYQSVGWDFTCGGRVWGWQAQYVRGWTIE